MQFSDCLDLLCCPRCKGPLAPPDGERLRCAAAGCGMTFPIVGGRPVLIDEARSVFALDDYRAVRPRSAPPSAGG